MKFRKININRKEDIFLVGWLFILVYYLIISGTKLVQIIPEPKAVKWIFVGLSLSLWLLKIIKDKYNTKIFVFIVSLCCILGLASVFSGKEILLVTIVFVIASKEVDLERFVRFDVFVRLSSILFIFLLTILNVLPSAVMNIDGVQKHTFGWLSANTFASNVVIVLLEFLYIKWKRIRLRDYAVVIGVLIFLYFYATARTSIFDFIFVLVWLVLVRKKTDREQKGTRKIGAVIYSLTVVGCVALSYILVFIYSLGNSLSTQIDRLFTHRLYFSLKYITKYGFSLFGQEVEHVSSVNAAETGSAYSGVDMSYFLIPIQYGILFFAFFIIYFSVILFCLYKYNRYREMMFVLFFLIAGITSNVVIQFYRNFTWLFIWIVINDVINNKRKVQHTRMEDVSWIPTRGMK